MKKAQCLLLTSFSDRSLQLKDILKKEFSDMGIEVKHPVDIDQAKPLFQGILEFLEQAEFLVADISDLNPNIIFEIGYALARELPIVILVDHKTDIPVSIRYESLHFIRYDKEKGLNMDQVTNILSLLKQSDKLRRKLDLKKQLLLPKEKRLLANPFDFLSAETIYPPELVGELFVVPPYFEIIRSPETAILFGPRGCGKTMLLYMLRLRQNIANSNVAGFYINFNRLRGAIEMTTAKSNIQKMTMYFNLTFLRAFANEVDIIRRLGRISEKEEKEVLSVVEHKIGFFVDSFSILSTILSHFEQQELTRDVYGLDSTEESNLPIIPIENKLYNPIFLEDLAESLWDTNIFSDYSIAYLLDDYSSDWLPKKVSCRLHRIIFRRSPCCSFKVATIQGRHMVWPLSASSYAEPYREYIPINMTNMYFSSIPSQIKFVQGVLNKRLEFAGSRLSSEALFGLRPTSKRDIVDYSGISGLARLFSGDCATIIGACGWMTQNSPLDEPISRESQNRILRSISMDIVESLKLGYKWGSYVYNFVSNMMEFAMKRYLYSIKVKGSKKKRRRLFSGFVLENFRKLSLESKEKLSWLVRSGVLLPYSRSSRRQRYAVRKILFPAFNIPIIGLKDYLFLNLCNSENMLNNPERFWKAKIKNIIDEFKT